MRRVLALGGVLLAFAGDAVAATWRTCEPVLRIQCTRVRVPLDRSGGVPGTVSLYVERIRAPGRKVLLSLSGGPGQAATAGTFFYQITLAPALRNRDLVAFDQRGTGRSGKLRCPGLARSWPVAAVERCGQALGPRRAFYRTVDSVEDIEAVRQAIGVPK